jgi:hypothetical protein
MSKGIVATLIAFVLGAGAGALAANEFLKKKYAAIAEDEIESVREMYLQKLAELSPPTRDEEGELIPPIRPSVDVAGAPLVRPTKVAGAKTTQYDKIKKNYSIQPEAEQVEPEGTPDEDETEEESTTDKAPMQKHPYLIGDEDFLNGSPEHDKISLYYYKPDDILCEENGDILSDIDTTVGWDAMAALEMQTSVWVRNERIGVDYEIIGVNQTYAESVHGMKEEVAPEPVVKPIRKRRKVSEE